jgi:hypothetical protein
MLPDLPTLQEMVAEAEPLQPIVASEGDSVPATLATDPPPMVAPRMIPDLELALHALGDEA